MLGPRRPVILTAAVSLALTAAACGADGERTSADVAAARAVVQRFGDATARHDYQVICDELLADELVKKVEDVGLPCELAFQKGVGEVRDPRLQVRQVKVQGARALVSVRSTATGEQPSDDAIQLVRDNGEWRIASLVSPGSAPGTGTTSTATTGATTSVPTPDHDDRDAAAQRKRERQQRRGG